MTRKPTVRFGIYEADLHTRELRRNGRRVPLQLQPILLLEALVSRAGDLVTRDELRRLLWPDGTHVSFERGLTSAMRKVREALDERADQPVFIETLSGRGYRFMAAVEIATVAPAPRFDRARWMAPMAAIVILGFSEGAVGPNPMMTERMAAAEALSSYACQLKSQGRFEDGLAAIRKAHALAPESARFTAEVGLHLHAARHYEEEMTMLMRAVRQDAGSADAWLHLGLGLARRSNFDAAIPALERANRISGASDQVRYWLNWARAQRTPGHVTS